MGEFKGSKGKWDFSRWKKDVLIMTEAGNVAVALRTYEKESEQNYNAELIAEAGNVRQQINCSLTELLEQRDELVKFVQDVEKVTSKVVNLLSREGIDDCEEARELDELWFYAHHFNNDY